MHRNMLLFFHLFQNCIQMPKLFTSFTMKSDFFKYVSLLLGMMLQVTLVKLAICFTNVCDIFCETRYILLELHRIFCIFCVNVMEFTSLRVSFGFMSQNARYDLKSAIHVIFVFPVSGVVVCIRKCISPIRLLLAFARSVSRAENI